VTAVVICLCALLVSRLDTMDEIIKTRERLEGFFTQCELCGSFCIGNRGLDSHMRKHRGTSRNRYSKDESGYNAR